MLRCLITALHLLDSLWSHWANSSGLVPSTSAPWELNLSLKSGAAKALLMAALSLSMMGRGVPVGTNMPDQDCASKPAKVLAMGATSGSSWRGFKDETPTARRRPLWMCVITKLADTIMVGDGL